jgi:hypothetical protein
MQRNKIRRNELLEARNKFWHDEWNDYYLSLKKFVDSNAATFPGPLSTSLERWLYKQQLSRNTGRLTAEQMEKLDSIRLNKFRHDEWNHYFLSLKKFVDSLATKDPGPLSSSLEHWLYKQQLSRNIGGLTADQMGKLNSIGLLWGNLYNFIWNYHYESLKEHVENFRNNRTKQTFTLSTDCWITSDKNDLRIPLAYESSALVEFT